MVGNPGELEAVKIIKSRFKDIGLQNVHLEPFKVMTSYHKLSELELLEPIHKKIICGRCISRTKNKSFSTGPEGYSGSIIDVGFGRIKDLERLKSHGVDFTDKIVLIEQKPKVSSWVPIAQAQKFGASAAILTSVLFERDIIRTYGAYHSSIPAISIPYIEAQAIRHLLLDGEVKANLKNILEVDVESTGYNVVGELLGKEYPDQVIILTAHHDSWYGAANDDLVGVAVMMQVAKVLLANHKNSRTIRFVTCGGEEGGSEPNDDDVAAGLAGSYAYTKQHKSELDKIVANINLDGFAYGLNSTLSLTSELEPLTKKLVSELESKVFYEYWLGPSTGLDQWNFIRQGIPSVSINPNMDQYMKIYHSARDTPELLSIELMRNVLKLTLSLVLKLDSDAILPYDFSSTAKKIIKDLSERSTKLEDTIGLKTLIENTTNFKVVAESFNTKFDPLKQKELDREAISLINNVQRKICSSLIPKLTNRKSGISLSSAQTLPDYLDALINIKKVILAAKQSDEETCMKSLKALTNNLWGLDFNPEIYEGWRDAVLASRRAQGLKFDLMPEARGLDEKFKKGIEDKSAEISSLEEKYKTISNQVSDKLLELNVNITKASASLTEVMYKVRTRKKSN